MEMAVIMVNFQISSKIDKFINKKFNFTGFCSSSLLTSTEPNSTDDSSDGNGNHSGNGDGTHSDKGTYGCKAIFV